MISHYCVCTYGHWLIILMFRCLFLYYCSGTSLSTQDETTTSPECGTTSMSNSCEEPPAVTISQREDEVIDTKKCKSVSSLHNRLRSKQIVPYFAAPSQDELQRELTKQEISKTKLEKRKLSLEITKLKMELQLMTKSAHKSDKPCTCSHNGYTNTPVPSPEIM